MANLGYIGLGVMGGRMADRLMARGHSVTGHNRTKAKAQWLLDKGMTWGDSPRAVAAASEVVFVVVTDSAALEAAASGPDGLVEGIGPGKIVVDSVAASPMVQYRGPMVLNMPDEAWFDMKMMQKDTALALELGRGVKVPLPTASVANEYLTAGRATGLEKKDFAAVFQVLARLSGVNE